MRSTLLSLALVGASAAVMAKLPAPDDAAKAKAAETSARSAWQARVDSFQLCRAQDRVASAYRKTAAAVARPVVGTASAPAATAASVTPPAATPAITTPPTSTAAVAVAPAVPAVPAAPAAAAAAASAPAAAASGATVATAPVPPCLDPGPFAYAPPEQKPLESAGAHSPTATAASPPSVRAPSAEMTPSPKK